MPRKIAFAFFADIAGKEQVTGKLDAAAIERCRQRQYPGNPGAVIACPGRLQPVVVHQRADGRVQRKYCIDMGRQHDASLARSRTDGPGSNPVHSLPSRSLPAPASSSRKRSASHSARRLSPNGGAAIDTSSCCHCIILRSCKWNHWNAACTRGSEASWPIRENAE